MGDNYKGDSTLKTFPFFPRQNKNQIHQKKWAFFPHFYLPLSLINWKVSTYANQNWKIQGKSFCINLAITVKWIVFFIAVCYACTSCCIICIWHFDIFLLNTIPRWNWWVQTPIQGCESYRSHFPFLKW